jgi:hypothetical protein
MKTSFDTISCSRPARHRMPLYSPPPGRQVRGGILGALCSLLLLASHAVGRDAHSSFDLANQAYAAGQWNEAERGYKQVLAQRGYSAPTLFNLANAQFRQGKLGQAILSYERARWLAPSDPDIAANLELARGKAGLAAERLSGLERLAQAMSWTAWSCLGTAMLLGGMAALLFRELLPSVRAGLTGSVLLFALGLLCSISALSVRWPELHRAIVTAPQTPARVSPVTVVQPLFALRAGEPVILKTTHGQFALIANGQGQEGWVPRDAITQIVSKL